MEMKSKLKEGMIITTNINTWFLLDEWLDENEIDIKVYHFWYEKNNNNILLNIIFDIEKDDIEKKILKVRFLKKWNDLITIYERH